MSLPYRAAMRRETDLRGRYGPRHAWTRRPSRMPTIRRQTGWLLYSTLLYIKRNLRAELVCIVAPLPKNMSPFSAAPSPKTMYLFLLATVFAAACTAAAASPPVNGQLAVGALGRSAPGAQSGSGDALFAGNRELSVPVLPFACCFPT